VSAPFERILSSIAIMADLHLLDQIGGSEDENVEFKKLEVELVRVSCYYVLFSFADVNLLIA
jgi:hypothetical protein